MRRIDEFSLPVSVDAAYRDVRYTPPPLIFFGAVRNGPGGISHRCRCMLIVRLLCARQVEIYN